MSGYRDHFNNTLDLVIEDGGLAEALAFVTKISIGKDFHGEDPFERKTDPLCFSWRLAANKNAVYIDAGVQDDTEPGWNALPPGMRIEQLIKAIRKALRHAAKIKPDAEFDGFEKSGWRILDARTAAWNITCEDEPEDFEDALACVMPHICIYPK